MKRRERKLADAWEAELDNAIITDEKILDLFKERVNLSCADVALLLKSTVFEISDLFFSLHKRGLLRHNGEEITTNSKFLITNKGKQFLYDKKVLRVTIEEQNRRIRHSEIRSWISLALAGIAIIVSIISLIIR